MVYIYFVFLFYVNILFAFDNPLVLINHDLQDGLISPAEAVELKARVLLIPESLPDRYKFAEPDHIRCGLGIIDDAEDYDDYSISLSKTLSDVDFAMTWHGTDLDGNTCADTCDSRMVITASKSL